MLTSRTVVGLSALETVGETFKLQRTHSNPFTNTLSSLHSLPTPPLLSPHNFCLPNHPPQPSTYSTLPPPPLFPHSVALTVFPYCSLPLSPPSPSFLSSALTSSYCDIWDRLLVWPVVLSHGTPQSSPLPGTTAAESETKESRDYHGIL